MQDNTLSTLFAWLLTVLVAAAVVPSAAAQPPDVVETCPTLEEVLSCSGGDGEGDGEEPRPCEHNHGGGQVVDTDCTYDGRYCPVFVSLVHPHELTCL